MSETERFDHIDSAVRKKIEGSQKWSKPITVNSEVDYATVFLEKQVHDLKCELSAFQEVDLARNEYRTRESQYINTRCTDIKLKINSITQVLEKLTK